MSSEEITKFLRSKGSVHDILSKASSLLADELDVYLPNRTIFILELLCDRLNDTQHFKEWKYQSELWSLLSKVWQSISTEEDVKVRNQIFKRVKLIESLTLVVKKEDPELWNNAFEFVELVKRDNYIDIDEHLAIQLVRSYSTSLNTIVPRLHQLKFDHEHIEKWTPLVYQLYQLPYLNVNYTITKKSYSKFVLECSPSLLKLASTRSENLPKSKDISTKLLVNGLFPEQMVSNFKGCVEQLLKSEIDEESISKLFQLAIDSLSSRQLDICEEVFLLITSAEKFHALSSKLLQVLAKVNKSLSTSFFKQIYISEIDAKQPDYKSTEPVKYTSSMKDIDWDLIIHLITLDIELAIEYSDIIMELASNEHESKKNKSTLDEKSLLKIGESILHAHLKGRELDKFFTCWAKNMPASSVWSSSTFVTMVSKVIDDFSPTQLQKLLGEIFDKFDRARILPLLVAIFKGLCACPRTKREPLKAIVDSNKEILASKKPEAWELRFYLLCLYDDTTLVDSYSTIVPSLFYYYTVFRLRELTEVNFPGDFQHLLLELLQKNPQELHYILNRWVVALEHSFSKDQLAEFVAILFTNLDRSQLIEYFSGAQVFYEQPKLTTALISYVTSELSSNHSVAELVPLIPIQCFGRSLKKSAMEALYKITPSENAWSRKAILHLLKSPSFRSTLETDFDSILALIDTSTTESKPLAFEILTVIWKHHLAQHTAKEHETYLTQALTKCNKSLAKPSKKLTPVLQAAYVLVANSSTSVSPELRVLIQELAKRFAVAVEALLTSELSKKSIDGQTVNWALAAIISVIENHQNYDSTGALVKSVGAKLTHISKETDSVKANLFNLSTHYLQKTSDDALYVLALYYILASSSSDTNLHLIMSSYLQSLDPQVFETLFEYVIESTDDSTDFNTFVPLLCTFIKSTKKEESHLVGLVNRTISLILTHLGSLDYSSHNNVLTTLKSCLGDSTWLFNQYGTESLVSLVTKYSGVLTSSSLQGSEIIDLYIKSTQVMSHILLFHRFKLSSRHHLIISVFVSLLTPLSNHSTSVLAHSKEAAAAFSRLLANLCEPPVSTISTKMALNSSTALIKRALRKHVPVLLINYIYLSLKYTFDNVVNEEIIGGIYSIFDVLSNNELQLVSSSLDIPGKGYYRTLYSNYKAHGKWKDQ